MRHFLKSSILKNFPSFNPCKIPKEIPQKCAPLIFSLFSPQFPQSHAIAHLQNIRFIGEKTGVKTNELNAECCCQMF
jgi:hypothetical protein